MAVGSGARSCKAAVDAALLAQHPRRNTPGATPPAQHPRRNTPGATPPAQHPRSNNPGASPRLSSSHV
eukprot:357407-Chlamydomonas_euryale.AAC.2